MRNKGVYGRLPPPIIFEKRSFMARPRSAINPAVKIKNDTANAPILTIEYALDNSRLNAGFNPGGACVSGFSDGANISAGASSGFFDF